jgi:hypothetical protein
MCSSALHGKLDKCAWVETVLECGSEQGGCWRAHTFFGNCCEIPSVCKVTFALHVPFFKL